MCCSLPVGALTRGTPAGSAEPWLPGPAMEACTATWYGKGGCSLSACSPEGTPSGEDAQERLHGCGPEQGHQPSSHAGVAASAPTSVRLCLGMRMAS